MNDIVSIMIENFQSHRKTVVEPAPAGQLTVIVGPSDSGKTAVIRALRWPLLNIPSGTDFIRVGADFARVTLTLVSGHKVIRHRTRGGVNRYSIVAPGADKPQVFEGMGNGVPLEVQELTGVRPVQIGDTEFNLNLAEQLDGPFLGKSVSAPAKAKVLGKLAGTEEIDYAGKTLATDLHRRGQDEKRLEAEIARLAEQIKEYDWLPALGEKIGRLEEMQAAVKTATERREKLAALAVRLADVDRRITDAGTVLARWQYIEKAEAALSAAEAALSKTQKIADAGQRYRAASTGISLCQADLKRLAGLEEAETIALAVAEKWSRADRLVRLERSYGMIECGIKDCEATLKQLVGLEEAEIARAKAEAAMVRMERLKALECRLSQVTAMIRLSSLNIETYAATPQAEALAAQIQEARERYTRLEGLSVALARAEKDIAEVQVSLRRWAGLDEAQLIVFAVEDRLVHRRLLEDHSARLIGINGHINTTRQNLVVAEHQVREFEGAYRDALLAAGTCPMCGSVVDPEKLKGVA